MRAVCWLVLLVCSVAASGKSIQLSNGASMPLIGLGTWKAKPGQVGAAVRAALAAGYRHLDCAAVYGNEPEVGQALRERFSAQGLRREDVFVTSKLWNSEHRPADVLPAVQQTLRELRLEYLDLYLIHWPQAFQKVPGTHAGRPTHANGSMIYDFEADLRDTWRAMEALVERGLVRAIGLSNFNQTQAERIIQHARVQPAVLQIESHPFLSQEALRAFGAFHNISITAYSPLGSGATFQEHTVATHPTLVQIGARHGKSAAQVAIAWQMHRGIVVIPKSVSEERIRQNWEASRIQLSQQELRAIGELNQRARGGWGGPMVRRNGRDEPRDLRHPDYPFAAEFDRAEEGSRSEL